MSLQPFKLRGYRTYRSLSTRGKPLQRGEYCLDNYSVTPPTWFGMTPNGLPVDLSQFGAWEKPDGTVMCSQRIYVHGCGRSWTGWLQDGMWSEFHV